MANATFSFDSTDDPTNESSTVTLAAGEKARVRFTTFTGPATAKLKIVINSTTSYVDIDDKEAWIASGSAELDVCSVYVDMGGSDRSKVIGIIEGVTA